MDTDLAFFKVEIDFSDNPRMLDAQDLRVQIFVSHDDANPSKSQRPAHTKPGSAKMFRDDLPRFGGLGLNTSTKGQVFTVTLRSQGIGIQSKEIATDLEAWEQCEECEQFRSCYDLSVGRLALENAIQSRF